MFSRKVIITSTLIILILIVGCDKNDVKPTEVERITKLLTQDEAVWTPALGNGVTVNGINVTDDLFKDFSITFSEDGTFTTTGTTPVFLRKDTWAFIDETGTVISRGQDEQLITIVSITPSEIVLSLQWDYITTALEDGKSKSIAGTHIFTMIK